MLLRRLTQSLLAQNWTAIAIEFVLLVAGVFLGIQAADWNQARHERAVERQYLQRLYDDMAGTLEDHEGANARWDADRLAGQALVLRALRAGELADADREAFDLGLMYFGYVAGPTVRWSTVEELQSTGSMGVIRDVALRGRIGELDASIKHKKGISATFTGSINAYRQQVGDRYAVLERKGYESATLQYDFQALASDPAFINILSQIDTLARLKGEASESARDEVRSLRDELAIRLGKPQVRAEPRGEPEPSPP